MVKKITSLFAAVALLCSSQVFAQSLTATFDDLTLPPDSFYNGADFAGSYMTGGITLPINYDTTGGWVSWAGFAYSNMTDTVTAGFGNQYSSFAGSGYNGSSNFGLYYSQTNDSINFPFDIQLPGFYITNNSYAAISMRDGDGFAKQFGGVNGTDPDYLRIRFQGFDENSNFIAEEVFYLADYRSSNSAQDYIVKDWTFVDLSGLGNIRSFAIVFESSDTGQFGINTPTYFCLDNFQLTVPTSIGPDLEEASFSVFPNPATELLEISLDQEPNGIQQFNLYNASAQLVRTLELIGSNSQLSLQGLPTGTYFLHQEGSNRQPVQILKQ